MSVDNFYFKDFTADYYLLRDEEGVSHLRVKENLTAVFPDFEQNKGICRQISSTNQNGANITLPKLDNRDISVYRNGSVEPIYSIEKYRGFYEVCTGDDNYVLGEQTYTFEYEFEKVVTDFGKYQELYWDTNGNGGKQRFDRVMANLHFVGMIKDDYQDLSWCYVGKYGESGQERCKITKTSDGVSFTAENLGAGENLTFDVQFEPNSFMVPKPEPNYTLVFILVALFGICAWAIIYIIRKYLKNREKEIYFKGFFVKPEYQPSTKYNLSELSELYMGKKKDMKVAILLDLIVRKKIELISESKKKWSLEILNIEGLREEEKKLLAILNGGVNVKVGDTVEIISRTATMTLVELNRDFYSAIRKELIAKKLVGDNYMMGGTKFSSMTSHIIINLIFTWPFLVFIMAGASLMFAEENFEGYLVLGRSFVFIVAAVLFLTILIWSIFSYKADRFRNITKLGIEAEKYMEGLELYIRMAEKERMKFLQSVEGADVSPKGVVKLYEKLLPYAAVFGLEESWMNEMKKYCEVQEIEEPNYLMTGLVASEISRTLNRTVSVANSSTQMASSGGGSSSGFSGGGGGGFSGGGGGGGGVSGR